MKFQKTALALGVALLASQAQAVSFSHNGVNLDINGTVNGFFVNREDKAAGSAAVRNSGVSNGLLPGWINFVATTKVDDLDLKAHFGFAPGINDNSSVVGLPGTTNSGGGGTGSPYTQIDTRNVYFSVGNAGWGSVKFGRDIGLFGQNIILSDMTLIGVGGTSSAAQPFNTTFGMIGTGYMYVGFQPQITYTSPKFGPATFAAGIFQPKQFTGTGSGATTTNSEAPGFQAKLDLDLAANTKLWAGALSQKNEGGAGTSVSPKGVTSTGFELGGKVGFGDAEFVAYGFRGEGLGVSTVGALFNGSANAAGQKTESQGYFLQGTYKLGKTKLGLNYGQNKDEKGAVGANEFKRDGYTAGVYHALNKHVTLVGEFNRQEQENNGAFANRSRTVSVGGILFF